VKFKCWYYIVILVCFSFSIDATEEPQSGPILGHLVNHGRKVKNCAMKVQEQDSIPLLCLYALRDISKNEEILYDYGIKELPWEVGFFLNIDKFDQVTLT